MSLKLRTYLSPVQNRLFHAVWDWVARHSDLDLDGETYSSTGPRSEVTYMCGLPTGRQVDRFEPLVAPVLAPERYGGSPVYFSDLVARVGTPGPPNLSWRIAYNERESFSGWIAPRWGLAAMGIEPDSMEWVGCGSHLASLEAVRNGAVDAAGIDSMVLDLLPGEAAPSAGLITIESFGPWPAPPLSTPAGMDRPVRAELARALTSMHLDSGGAQLLATWGVERLAAVDAAEYSRLADLAATTAKR